MNITSDLLTFANYLQTIGCLHDIRNLELTPRFISGYPYFDSSHVTESGLSPDQISYLSSLSARESFAAIKADFCQISFFNGSADSKDIFISPDFQLIYDAKPHWLTPYLGPISSLSGVKNLPQYHRSNCCVPGGLLSFSHFVGRNLSPFILFGSSLGLPYILPRESQWQRRLINVYSPSCKTIYFDHSNIVSDNISIASFRNSWLFEELLDWESLLLARAQLPKIVSRLDADLHQPKRTPPSDRIYISRLRYETLNNKTCRTSNWVELFHRLNDLSFSFIFPENTSIISLLSSLYRSKLIVSDSGSAFINYVLFSSSTSRIIQLVPRTVLAHGTSFNLLSPMQWYLPILPQIQFFPSNFSHSLQSSDRFSWNDPSSYNAESLACLINSFKES